jgi:hypothetical protein
MGREKNHNVLNGIAKFTGRVAGSVEAEVETLVDTAKHLRDEPVHPDVRFEPSDLNAKATFLVGVGLVVLLFVTPGILFFYFTGLAHHRAAVSRPPLPIQAHGDVVPPAPRLQSSSREDLKKFRERENWELTHYHWLDKAHGIVAIPVEDAIQIVAKRGIPSANTPPNPTLTPPLEGTRQTGFEGKVEPEPAE